MISWDESSLSDFQFKVKQFLKPFWQTHVVAEELLMAGTRSKIDLFNSTKKVAIECDGKQHLVYSDFMHQKSRSNYLAQKRRDAAKERWCELNGISLVRIKESDLKSLSRDWFKERGVIL